MGNRLGPGAGLAREHRYRNSLQENNTWVLNDRTEVQDRMPLRNKWMFRIKISADGTLGYKARLVIKEYEQQAGIDYQIEELYAPVAKFVSIKALFALAAFLD